MPWAAKWFKPEEFDSPDAPGSGLLHMDPDFMARLDHMRELCGFPIIISSGYATPQHNEDRGGAPNSWHMRGRASDMPCRDGAKRYHMVAAAFLAGFTGIEICNGHIHVDTRDGAPYCWTDLSK